MLKGLFLFSLFHTCKRIIEETFAPTIPAENWANEDLIRQDRMRGISEKEFSRNLANGKYRLTETFPEPHILADGRIIIENYELYKEDCRKYGVPQAHKWMRQGKYNLTPEEVAEREKRFKEEMEHLYSLL